MRNIVIGLLALAACRSHGPTPAESKPRDAATPVVADATTSDTTAADAWMEMGAVVRASDHSMWCEQSGDVLGCADTEAKCKSLSGKKCAEERAFFCAEYTTLDTGELKRACGKIRDSCEGIAKVFREGATGGVGACELYRVAK